MVIVALEHELASVIEKAGLCLPFMAAGHELDADLVLTFFAQTRHRLVMRTRRP